MGRTNPAGSLVPFGLGREAEDPLADDVALDLVGTTVNGLGPGEEEGALDLAQVVGSGPGSGPAVGGQDRGRRPEQIEGELAQPAMPTAPIELGDGKLRWRHRAVD